MKNFFKMMFASMLGTFLALFAASVMFFLFVLIVVAAVEPQKDVSINENTILQIRLDYPIAERTPEKQISQFSFTSFRFSSQLGLNDIISNIRKAKHDPNIKGIWLDLNGFSAGGYATVEAIRNALIDFKSSKKFIIAYGDIVVQKALYLASISDKIYVSQPGLIELKGLSTEVPFFKKTLEKLEIEAQIFHYGKYKSAIEPFRFDKMSDPYRYQMTTLLNSMYDHLIFNTGSARNIDTDSLKMIADNLLVRDPESAMKYRLIDGVYYRDQVVSEIKKRIGVGEDKDLNTITIQKYNNVVDPGRKFSENKIAVIYAEGDVVSGSGDDNSIGAENIPEALRKAAKDKRVRAIVLRVNSPGGDALTSDLIWREVQLAKKKKPVIVSMGSVAASGGYYISTGADVIVAEPNTITGSIGVFGIIPNMEKFFSNKLGITFDRVKTGKYSDFMTINRPFTAQEKMFIQNEIDKIYKTFVGKVAEGRKKTFAQIDEIAQGRVWTGLQAKQNGLVDEIGGLEVALKIAASRARLKEYSIVELPVMKDFVETLLEDFSAEASEYWLKAKLGSNYAYYKQLDYVTNASGIQARLPVDPDIK
ncbi:MAG: signal peptide peptidase SppA [Bacteroidota bacterium]